MPPVPLGRLRLPTAVRTADAGVSHQRSAFTRAQKSHCRSVLRLVTATDAAAAFEYYSKPEASTALVLSALTKGSEAKTDKHVSRKRNPDRSRVHPSISNSDSPFLRDKRGAASEVKADAKKRSASRNKGACSSRTEGKKVGKE